MVSKTTKQPEPALATAHQPEQPRTMLPIDALREKHRVTRPVFVGVCAANSWESGKVIAEEAFLQAIASFTKSPMGGCQRKRG